MKDKLNDQVIIKNMDGTEIEVAAKVECKHIYGYSETCNEIYTGSEEYCIDSIKLILDAKENMDEIFPYCPRCGKKLIDD